MRLGSQGRTPVATLGLASPSLLRGDCNHLLHHPQQLATPVHVHHNVAATHQFALNVELRDRRPIRIGLECLAKLWILEDIDMREASLAPAKRIHYLSGETALRKIRRAFHKEHYGARRQIVLDPFNGCTSLIALLARSLHENFLPGSLV